MSWIEEQPYFSTEDMAEQFSDPEELIKQGYWVQADREPIALSAMDYRHLCNCINMIENGRLARPWALPYLKDEQRKRLHR